jgi:hypothetical protein
MLSWERRHPPDELSYHKRQMGGESIPVGSFLLLQDDDGSEISILLLQDDAGAEIDGLLLQDN